MVFRTMILIMFLSFELCFICSSLFWEEMNKVATKKNTYNDFTKKCTQLSYPSYGISFYYRQSRASSAIRN